jgi:2-polyprenyl-3-methyl-5-hydroxy-6-metoxy-1,4-benzoquinol methylase
MKNFAGIDFSFLSKKDHILDYGSGDGRVTVYLLKKGFLVTALDIDLNSKNKILSQLNDQEKSRFTFIHLKKADSFDNYNNKFDCIVCREVLEHIADYKSVVNIFSKILKKNSRCIISVPTYFPEKLFSFFGSDWLKKCEHVNVFKKKDIINLAHSNDLILHKISTHSFNRTIFWAMVSPLKVEHNMGKILNKSKWIKFAEYFSYGVCKFKFINKIGNFIALKSRVFYLRQNKNEF